MSGAGPLQAANAPSQGGAVRVAITNVGVM